jgi:hypothetical protein
MVNQKSDMPAKGWWTVRFCIKWPQDSEPSWHIDLLLACEIISPVLEQYRKEIALWRFHRMASRQHGGHQFSFHLYATPMTAEEIFNAFRLNKLLKRMQHTGLISEIHYDATQQIGCPHIGDTSDHNWSASIQKTWPYFITGVSEMWLALVHEHAETITGAKKRPSFNQLPIFYQQVNDAVTKTWREECGHALLHHLNALFGYTPVMIHEVRLARY